MTLGKLKRGDFEYLTPELAGRYDLYLSFTGGPTLERIKKTYGVPRPRALYCSVDPDVYRPQEFAMEWDLGYLGTYSDDRQPALESMLISPARAMSDKRFVVAGPQYPESIEWPQNVQRIEHLGPVDHREFYNSQRFTLNVTRQAMVEAGWSPSVRLFEAAACGVPIISDYWPGLEEFFRPGKEILLEDTAGALANLDERERRAIGLRARDVVLRKHTAACRAIELENYVNQVSFDTARRNGHGRKAAIGTHVGDSVEREGAGTIGAVGATAGGNGSGGSVQAVLSNARGKQRRRWGKRCGCGKGSRSSTTASGQDGAFMTWNKTPSGARSMSIEVQCVYRVGNRCSMYRCAP